jgi:hypothetical protein
MYAALVFDTEDVYYPPQYRIDDIPRWLAEIMTETGLRGTFVTMGEKARSLKARGREDVLEAMARHDLASHQRGNCRPLLPQVVERCGWDDGMDAVREYEDGVRQDFLEAFGREPIAFSRHNSYFAPQHIALAGERGLPYLYPVIDVAGFEQPVWYAGTVCLGAADRVVGHLDTAYSNDAVFAQRFEGVQTALDRIAGKGCEFVTLFGCHPCRVMTRGWPEHHVLASGMMRPPEQLGWLYAVKTPAEEARARANFRRLCEYFRAREDLEIVGLEKAGRLFSSQPDEIPRDALTAYAAEVEAAGKPLLNAAYSPAELVCGLAESLAACGSEGDLPAFVPRRDVLGPVDRPVCGPEKSLVTAEGLQKVCRELADRVREKGRLPANVALSSERLGIGQILLLAARAYRALANYDRYGRLHNTVVQRYPDAAFEIDDWIRSGIGEHWGLPLDFDHSRLAELARLQTWTLKPAWLKPPSGPAAEGARELAPTF